VRTRKKVKVKVDEDTDVEVENTPAEVVVVKEEVKPVPVDQLTQDFYARKQRFHDLQEKI
jgi:hypothetical protein